VIGTAVWLKQQNPREGREGRRWEQDEKCKDTTEQPMRTQCHLKQQQKARHAGVHS